MGALVNFHNANLEAILSDWLLALGELSVDAIVILGPDPFGSSEDRVVIAAQPTVLSEAAQALAESSEFGTSWRDSDAPLVAWQTIARSDPQHNSRWRLLWLARGYQTLVRVEFSLPAGRAFECFMFSGKELTHRPDAALIVWSALNIWPVIKRSIAAARSTLSPRELECLELAFRGLTARESAEQLHCTERTVNYHLANAMTKLKVDNKLAAIQRACWTGAL
jgi:LuxR family transcriptional regulator, quorum-sensing system regulator SolR